MKNLYIIAGSNGSGKTTASYTVLPDMLNCKEFVNADEIAKGLSPFQPEKVAIQSGRLMLNRIKTLLSSENDFAFETTLSTRHYVNTIKKAKLKGFSVTVLYLWLNSPDLSVERVKNRVKEGGHNIPEDVIRRRYIKGLKNMFNLYIPISDYWIIVDNSNNPFELVAEGKYSNTNIISNKKWNYIQKQI